MAKVLVTGGAGYIGAHTVVCLREAGHDVTIVDDLRRSDPRVLAGLAAIVGEEPRVLRVDVGDARALRSALRGEAGSKARPPFDAVVHFAAYKSVKESVAEPRRYYRNNVAATSSLLEVLAELGVTRLVFSSSCTVYGQPDVLPVTEDSPQAPAASPYGATKQMCERMIADDVAATGSAHLSHAVALRYFNPAGAHPSSHIGELPLGVPDNLVPFITQTAAGWRDCLQVFGTDYDTVDGTAVRDYLHVMDLADAHVAAVGRILRSEPGVEVFNLGSGRGQSVLQAVEAFERATGVEVRRVLAARRPGDVAQIWSACEKANEVLGWRATRSLDDIMRSAWAWQQTLGSAPPAVADPAQ